MESLKIGSEALGATERAVNDLYFLDGNLGKEDIPVLVLASEN